LGDYFGQLFESDKGSPNFSATFFVSKSYALNSAKMGLATFWAIFPQTPLATLAWCQLP
jgi:hypothetical protein